MFSSSDRVIRLMLCLDQSRVSDVASSRRSADRREPAGLTI